ncbi:hypothetical protein QJQ45_010502 [Haematococcus lacustris]|nr:hypothetical protein QJQ45_010502 [Haematococcus lacustris]
MLSEPAEKKPAEQKESSSADLGHKPADDSQRETLLPGYSLLPMTYERFGFCARCYSQLGFASCRAGLCERDSGEKAGERDVPNRRRPGSPHSYSGLVTPVAPVALVAPPLPVPTLQLPRLRRLLPRLPRKPEQEELKKQIKDYLAKGVIEPSSSPYAAPILFVQKKSGELRMCIDYRQLNKLTLRDQYPLPRIDDLFDRLSGCSVFSSLDLQAGYHQIRITPEDVPKTAFRTPEGHFQFKVLSFGLTNAPATFQRVMNDAFAPVLGKCALVYLDDILVMSKSLPDHMQHLRLVFDLLRANKLYAKMSKSLAEFAVNNSWHESIQSTPFLVNTGQSPVTVGLRDLPYGGRCPSAHAFTRWWQDAVANARKCMAAAQSRQAAYANKARRDVEYKVGQKVLLSTKNLKLRPGKARKLIPRYVGPYEILLLVSAVAVKLDLPASMSRLHPVFHVSLIKPYTGTDVGFMPPPVTWMDETPVYYVERLLDHQGVKDNKASFYPVQ